MINKVLLKQILLDNRKDISCVNMQSTCTGAVCRRAYIFL